MKLVIAVLVCMTTMVSVQAREISIGVTMAAFDDKFLTLIRHGIEAKGKELDINLTVVDAQNEVDLQLEQIDQFIASNVDAIVVSPVDTNATIEISEAAEAAGVPLVYVNRQPINLEFLPDNQAFIASNEVDSGTMQTEEVCRLLKGKGKILVLMGALSDQTGMQRTQDIHDVISNNPKCGALKVVAQETGVWQRANGKKVMANWLNSGIEFNAVISNNDEMAIGAIEAMKAKGTNMKRVVVAGVDATPDALEAMKAGDLDVTVFQDAKAQGGGSVVAARQLALGEAVEQTIWVPFELVTPANMNQYINRN